MKRLIGIGTALLLALVMTTGAFAMEVPTDTKVQNLNGSQQYVKIYTVSPGTDPKTLIEEPFDCEGYTYTFASVTKRENRVENEIPHTEKVTVETAKKDLSSVLDALEPRMDWGDGKYSGTLYLDTGTISTRAAGYTSKSYTVSDTREYDALPSNDMSYVAQTAEKDGVTLKLTGVDWQVQATELVDGVLVPSQYKAVASYSATAWYSAATGYVTTAEYSGSVSCSYVDSVTYTLIYTGTQKAAEAAPEETPARENGSKVVAHAEAQTGSAPHKLLLVGGCAVLAVIFALAAALVLSRRENGRLRDAAEDAEYETQNENNTGSESEETK